MLLPSLNSLGILYHQSRDAEFCAGSSTLAAQSLPLDIGPGEDDVDLEYTQ